MPGPRGVGRQRPARVNWAVLQGWISVFIMKALGTVRGATLHQRSGMHVEDVCTEARVLVRRAFHMETSWGWETTTPGEH